MDLQLQDKIALVTGSTSGIGKAIAKLLAREGAKVIINGRSEERVEATVQELKAIGSVYGIAADLSTAAGAEQLATTASEIGSVDILINNAGKFELKPFFEITDEEWFDFFNFNVMSGVRLARLLMPSMLERNWGRIIFVSSESGVQINPEQIHYSTTKTAQIAVARGLAEVTKSTGVTVNSVLVGPTWTEGLQDWTKRFASDIGKDINTVKEGFFEHDVVRTSLLQRHATPEEIANPIIFLCSPNAAYINGAAQHVEGGLIRAIL